MNYCIKNDTEVNKENEGNEANKVHGDNAFSDVD